MSRLSELRDQIRETQVELDVANKNLDDARTFSAENRRKGWIFVHTAIRQDEIIRDRLLPKVQELEAKIRALKAAEDDELEAEQVRRAQRTAVINRQKQANLTHGELVPATLYPVNNEGVPKSSALHTLVQPVFFHFNPKEYSLKIKNKYSDSGLNQNKNYNIEFDSEIEPRKLTLSSIWFDTTASGEDVSLTTDKLMMYAEQDTAGADLRTSLAVSNPTYAAFEWGTFRFLSVVESVMVEFIRFRPDGIPVRAKASLGLKEFKHRALYSKQNPTSGGRPEVRLWKVAMGDRLDTIATKIYGDPTDWRLIAQHNNILDPFSLQPGRTLEIPARWQI
ncbi:MAG: hypothetical protein AB8G95_14290 [Anaerolineae bacterium]